MSRQELLIVVFGEKLSGAGAWQDLNKDSLFSLADYVSGGELFTHVFLRDHFTEDEVRIYIGEVILALEHLHKVNTVLFSLYSTYGICLFPYDVVSPTEVKTPVIHLVSVVSS